MQIDIRGDALRLLEHFVRYSNGSGSDSLADAMSYDKDGFRARARALEKALRKAEGAPRFGGPCADCAPAIAAGRAPYELIHFMRGNTRRLSALVIEARAAADRLSAGGSVFGLLADGVLDSSHDGHPAMKRYIGLYGAQALLPWED